MMDLKEIIKWFIPCFHILLANLKDLRLTFICLFLILNLRVGCAANVKSVEIRNDTKNVDSLFDNKFYVNQSDVTGAEVKTRELPDFFNDIRKSFSTDGSVGRTFGRPFKKMMSALIPLVFQIGAASTWAVVAALVGVKTLAVTLLILKILLIAGAAKAFAVAEKAYLDDRRHVFEAQRPYYSLLKLNGTTQKASGSINSATGGTTIDAKTANLIGALFGSKVHGPPQHQPWEPPHHPQKEIHLHIHNGHHDTSHDDHGPPVYGGWSRDDGANVIDTKPVAINPYSMVGPQTIRTPFGNYVKVEDSQHAT